MAGVCLPKFAADAFKTRLKDGTIDPGKLAGMTSDERRAFFADFLGDENAKTTNALFESKLLLKDQQRGMINWAKTLTGIKEPVRRDIIDKVGRLGKVLEPDEVDSFLHDLVEQRLGVGVSAKEASKIAELSKAVEDAKVEMQNTGDRAPYGKARVAFANYVSDLKLEAAKLSPKELLTQNPLKTLSQVGGQTKSLKASLDNSAIFRQGWKTMMTNPIIWQKNARQSFVDLVRTFGGKEVMDEVHADILSRPTYDAMRKAKLAIDNVEEAFPSSVLEKAPFGVGRAYKASETAYTAFVQRTRADVFDQYLKIAEKSGVDISDKKELEAIGKIVNSLTGRGNLGAAEPAADFFNNIFFSPRFLKSNIDLLTVHALDKNITPFARKKAAENLVKVVVGTAGVLALTEQVAKAFGVKDPVDWDPRSTDFGKLKVGNTRFDLTGGVGSIATLVAREISGKSKSPTTGAVTDLTSGKFGMPTRLDVATNYITGKFGPLSGVVRDWMKGQDYNGNKPTVGSTVANLLLPLPITNYAELAKDPNSANDLISIIADGLGISVNDYAPRPKKPAN